MSASLSEKLAKMDSGNPPPEGSGFFGSSCTLNEAQMILLTVPWDLTASFGRRASLAPLAMLDASHQMDLYDLDFGKPFLAGISHCEIDVPFASSRGVDEVNAASQKLNLSVYRQALNFLERGNFVGIVGGDHSCPFGLIKALGERDKEFGILHIDAHHDLRDAYEGFHFSHASIMRRVAEDVPNLTKIVSVGVRDFCASEFKYANELAKIKTYYDVNIARELAEGFPFEKTAKEISDGLPRQVYISFDIDGLDPVNCPATGTPVPGGLSYAQALYLIVEIAKQHEIIGFDICEVGVADDDLGWNANVGARILYKLIGSTTFSNRLTGSL